jgi:hypothetical protein
MLMLLTSWRVHHALAEPAQPATAPALMFCCPAVDAYSCVTSTAWMQSAAGFAGYCAVISNLRGRAAASRQQQVAGLMT